MERRAVADLLLHSQLLADSNPDLALATLLAAAAMLVNDRAAFLVAAAQAFDLIKPSPPSGGTDSGT